MLARLPSSPLTLSPVLLITAIIDTCTTKSCSRGRQLLVCNKCPPAQLYTITLAVIVGVYCNCGKGLGVCVRNQKFVLVSWIIFFTTEQHLDMHETSQRARRREKLFARQCHRRFPSFCCSPDLLSCRWSRGVGFMTRHYTLSHNCALVKTELEYHYRISYKISLHTIQFHEIKNKSRMYSSYWRTT